MLNLRRSSLVWNTYNKQVYARSIAINSPAVIKADDKIRPWHEIPGPLSLPIIGQLLHYLPGGLLHNKSQTAEFQELLYRKYGPIVRLNGNVGFPPITVIFDPEVAISIFRKEDTHPVRPGFESLLYHRKNYFRKNEDDPLGLILGQSAEWKKLRSLANPLMLQPKTVKQYTKCISEVSEDMIKRMKMIRNKNNRLEGNFLTEMNLWAMESIGVVTLGFRLNCFDPNLSEDSPAKKLIQIIPNLLIHTEKLDFQSSLWRYVATPIFKRGLKVYDEFFRMVELLIQNAMNELQYKEKTKDEDKSIFEKLLEIDSSIAGTVAIDLILAAMDTSSNTMLALLYLLATNPEKQDKLREEIMLKQEKRPYTKACIKEAMRLFPVVGGIFRLTTKEHNALGYHIPKNMNILVGNQYLCLTERQFPRPTEFIPERWLVEKNDPLYYGNVSPLVYAPFGFGSRSCIGRRISELELETFVTKIIESFELDWTGPTPKTIRHSTINYFIEPFDFVFKDIKN